MVSNLDQDLNKGAVEIDFEDFPIDIGCVKVEDFDPESAAIEQEVNRCHVGESPNGPIKLEITDGDGSTAEVNQPESEQLDIAVVVPRDDDSIDEELPDDDEHTDSGSNILEEVASGNRISNKLRREYKTRGLSYTTTTGRICPARAVRPNCGADCKFQCFSRVPDEVRPQLLENLLQLSQNDQRKFLSDHICSMPGARPRSFSGRFHNFYFLPVESRLVKVCRTMFMNTYDLHSRTLRNIITKKVGDKHAVCGNPNYPTLLKKGSTFYFDYNEGYGEAVAVLQEDCEEGCKCELQCETKFPTKVIERMRKSYRKMSKEQQRNFLSKYIQVLVDKRNNRDKNPLYRAHFTLPLGSTVAKVCRKMFLHTFQLKSSQVRILLNEHTKNPDLLDEVVDPFVFAKAHIAAHRMDEDHHCAVSGALVKLSHCPNVARMYSQYLEGCQVGVEPVDFRQYYAEFCIAFAQTGLLLPTKCPGCGFFERGG
uniref:(northern house mosquito) hypothetical protein n=1 Tax=Culex pipiens TaxID=7175 RepID=A0A8D8BI71_CULPI